MHPYGIEQVTEGRIAELIGQADRARAAASQRGHRWRGREVLERIGRRLEWRRPRPV